MLKRVFKRMREIFPNSTVNIECYRCDGCGGVITSFDIKHLNKTGEGDACRCGINQFRPTNPSLKEKIQIVLKYLVRGC